MDTDRGEPRPKKYSYLAGSDITKRANDRARVCKWSDCFLGDLLNLSPAPGPLLSQNHGLKSILAACNAQRMGRATELHQGEDQFWTPSTTITIPGFSVNIGMPPQMQTFAQRAQSGVFGWSRASPLCFRLKNPTVFAAHSRRLVADEPIIAGRGCDFDREFQFRSGIFGSLAILGFSATL